MKRVLLAGLLVLLAVPAFAQTPATPAGTSTPAATASPDASEDREAQSPAVGGFAYEKAVTFDGGAQIGKEADGASLLTFVKRVKLTVNPVAIVAGGGTTLIRGAATGAVAGDFAACSLPIASASGVVIKSVATGTDTIDVELVGLHNGFLDAGAIDIQCLVVR